MTSDAKPREAGAYTRAQFAAAVDEAHALYHLAEEAEKAPASAFVAKPDTGELRRRAHEALHRVGAGQPRVACATPDPEAQRLYRELIELGKRELPCGHTIADLIYGGPGIDGMPAVTKCGACVARWHEAKAAKEQGCSLFTTSKGAG